MAKIEEAKKGITFQVIDRAIPPEKKIKPKRRQKVMFAGVVSLFAGIFLVFFLEYLENLKKPEESDWGVISERDGSGHRKPKGTAPVLYSTLSRLS